MDSCMVFMVLIDDVIEDGGGEGGKGYAEDDEADGKQVVKPSGVVDGDDGFIDDGCRVFCGWGGGRPLLWLRRA